MNTFQKVGVFIVRLIGIIMVVIAVMGASSYAVHEARGTVNTDLSQRLPIAIEWFITGGLLSALSKPIGKFLGVGLG